MGRTEDVKRNVVKHSTTKNVIHSNLVSHFNFSSAISWYLFKFCAEFRLDSVCSVSVATIFA